MGGDACGPTGVGRLGELWELGEPLLPSRERRSLPGKTAPARPPVPQGILYVLHTGIPWHDLPPELGLGSGVICWPGSRSGSGPGCGSDFTACF